MFQGIHFVLFLFVCNFVEDARTEVLFDGLAQKVHVESRE